MKKQVVLALALFAPFAAVAQQFEERDTEVHRTRHRLSVDLNAKTVLCSQADYSSPMLKVLIPGLGDITLLDHQNTGAGAPCVTTGESCSSRPGDGGARPEDILQGRSGVETIDIEVVEHRIESIDHQAKTCEVAIVENIYTEIRGKKLTHERFMPIGIRAYSDCVHNEAL